MIKLSIILILSKILILLEIYTAKTCVPFLLGVRAAARGKRKSIEIVMVNVRATTQCCCCCGVVQRSNNVTLPNRQGKQKLYRLVFADVYHLPFACCRRPSPTIRSQVLPRRCALHVLPTRHLKRGSQLVEVSAAAHCALHIRVAV